MATELDATSSGWGLSASPLVVDDTVIIGAVGTLAGYDRDTGASRWLAPDGGNSYGSPHPVTIDGVRPVPLLAATGLTSVAPDGYAFGFDGSILASVDLDTGQRAWKGRPLRSRPAPRWPTRTPCSCSPSKGTWLWWRPREFVELARLPALSGKSWNHPVLVSGTRAG